jgi:threonine dehydratase
MGAAGRKGVLSIMTEMGGAAVGIAAVLSGGIDIWGKVIATIVTGGNIDSTRFCALLNRETTS